MAKPKRTPLEKIQTLKTKDVAKLFFFTYLTSGLVTKILHKKASENCREKNKQSFVMPYIRDTLKEWQEMGFIETSPNKIPFNVKRKSGKSYILKNYGYRLNFEPLYHYCKERNIEFTSKEKKILNKILGFEFMRGRIIDEYPNDDVINATIKFYLKVYGLPCIEVLNEEDTKLLELAVKINEKEIKRIEELKRKIKKNPNTQKTQKLSQVEFERVMYNKAQEILCEELIDKKTKKLKISLNDLKNYAKFNHLLLFVSSYKKHPKLSSSINKKFKKALGIWPYPS